MEEWPPNMEGSCEYIEKAVADSQQGVALQFGGWTRCQHFLTVKRYDVTKHYIRLRNSCRAVMNVVMNLRVPYSAGNFLTG
jgi:hypothetical protein